jgi:hypothetical protein
VEYTYKSGDEQSHAYLHCQMEEATQAHDPKQWWKTERETQSLGLLIEISNKEKDKEYKRKGHMNKKAMKMMVKQK